MKKNNRRGFTLVEIIIVIGLLSVIAGIFAINLIKNLNTQKEDENKNVATQIISAANVYVSVNPEKVESLYNGFGYVDIKVGELRDAGLLSEELMNSETGEKIPDEDKVRVQLDVGDKIDVIYPIPEELEDINSWQLVADVIEIEYDKNNSTASWCAANEYMGLGNKTGTKLSFLNNKTGAWYTGQYKKGINVKVESCNVNPQITGTYTIVYKFIDPSTNIERTKNRNVYVKTSKNDVVSFEAVINDGKKVIMNTASNSVPIYIIETYKDGSKSAKLETTIGNMERAIQYSIEKFSTSTQGDFKAIVKAIKVNADGTKPSPAESPYSVIGKIVDMVEDGYKDCGNTYVKYAGNIYNIYNVDKTQRTVNVIYTATNIKAPYGQLGPCKNSSCCNGGRYTYNGLGQSTTGLSMTSMDDTLDEFYVSHHVASAILQSQYTQFGVKKVALLSKTEYSSISATCTKSNNIVNATFWLIDSKSASGGPGNYNKGKNAAHATNYVVMNDGTVGSGGAHKGTTQEGDYGLRSVKTDQYVVKPTLKLYDPEITGGTGSYSNPYIIKLR